MRIARAFLHCLRRCEPELLESIVGNLERPRGQRRRPRGQRQLQRKLSHGRVGWPCDWLGAATTSPTWVTESRDAHPTRQVWSANGHPEPSSAWRSSVAWR